MFFFNCYILKLVDLFNFSLFNSMLFVPSLDMSWFFCSFCVRIPVLVSSPCLQLQYVLVSCGHPYHSPAKLNFLITHFKMTDILPCSFYAFIWYYICITFAVHLYQICSIFVSNLQYICIKFAVHLYQICRSRWTRYTRNNDLNVYISNLKLHFIAN